MNEGLGQHRRDVTAFASKRLGVEDADLLREERESSYPSLDGNRGQHPDRRRPLRAHRDQDRLPQRLPDLELGRPRADDRASDSRLLRFRLLAAKCRRLTLRGALVLLNGKLGGLRKQVVENSKNLYVRLLLGPKNNWSVFSVVGE
jgi:hypothetical protein